MSTMPPFHVLRVTQREINARFPEPVWGCGHQGLRDLRPEPGHYIRFSPARGIRSVHWDLWNDSGGDFAPLSRFALGPFASSEEAHHEAMTRLGVGDDEEERP